MSALMEQPVAFVKKVEHREKQSGAVKDKDCPSAPDESGELDAELDRLFDSLSPKARKDALEKRAAAMASLIASEEVGRVLKESGKSLRAIQSETGLDPATISRVVTGARESGPKLSTIIAIAMALGKNVTLKIE